jgi:hypothetical protein
MENVEKTEKMDKFVEVEKVTKIKKIPKKGRRLSNANITNLEGYWEDDQQPPNGRRVSTVLIGKMLNLFRINTSPRSKDKISSPLILDLRERRMFSRKRHKNKRQDSTTNEYEHSIGSQTPCCAVACLSPTQRRRSHNKYMAFVLNMFGKAIDVYPIFAKNPLK